MKTFYFTLSLLLTLSASAAEPPQCTALTDERFTEQEIESIKRGDSTYNALVREALTYKVNDEIAKNLRSDFDRAKKIDWAQAKRMILNGLVVMTVQSHKRNVFLISRSGAVYQSTETRLDEVDELIQKVDPCGILIKSITE